MTTKIDHLIDHDMIKAATETHLAATSRLATAATERDTAKAAHAAARQASERAIAGHGDPLEAEHALNAAETVLRVHEKVHAAATAAHTAAVEGIATARSEALIPAYREGIRRRLASAKKVDAAKAALDAAQAEYDAATALLNAATQGGCQHVIYDASHGAGRPVGTYEQELKLWSVSNGWHNGKPEAL